MTIQIRESGALRFPALAMRGNAVSQAEFDALEAEVIAARSGEVDLDARIDDVDDRLQDTRNEVLNARDTYPDLDARLDAMEVASAPAGDLDALEAEVIAAREGETSLDAKLDIMESAAAATTAEVVAARGGEASLDARLDAEAAARIAVDDTKAFKNFTLTGTGLLTISDPNLSDAGAVWDVPKAVSADVLAGANDTKAVTSAAMRPQIVSLLHHAHYAITVTGGPVAYTGTNADLIALSVETLISFVLPVGCGASPTLDVNGLGAVPLRKSDGSTFEMGDLRAGVLHLFAYRGSVWRYINWQRDEFPAGEALLPPGLGDTHIIVNEDARRLDVPAILPPGLGFTSAIVDETGRIVEAEGDHGFEVARAQPGMGLMPLGTGWAPNTVVADPAGVIVAGVTVRGETASPLNFEAFADDFLEALDANSDQQVFYSDVYGQRQLTYGPDEKTLIDMHGPGEAVFRRKGLPRFENARGVVRRRKTALTFATTLVRIVAIHTDSKAFGVTVPGNDVPVDEAINRDPPSPNLYAFANGGVAPARANTSGLVLTEAGLGTLVPAFEHEVGPPNPNHVSESPAVGLGMGVLDAIDHSGPVIVFSGGQGGANLAAIAGPTTTGGAPTHAYANFVTMLTTARNRALDLWPGAEVRLELVVTADATNDTGTGVAAFQTTLGQLIGDITASAAAITGQVTPPLFQLGQSRRTLTGEWGDGDEALLAYALANPAVLWRSPPYSLWHADQISHIYPRHYTRWGQQMAHSYATWLRTGSRRIPRIVSARLNGSEVVVTFGDVVRLGLDRRIKDDGRLGFVWADSTTSARVTGAHIAGPTDVIVTLSNAPTGTGQTLRLASSNAYEIPSPISGARTPLVDLEYVDFDTFTGEPLVWRPAMQDFVL